MRFAVVLACALVLCAAGDSTRPIAVLAAPAPAPDSAPALAPAPAPASAHASAPASAPRVGEDGICWAIVYPGKHPQFVAKRDVVTSFVGDGDDLLSIVNRSPLFTLP